MWPAPRKDLPPTWRATTLLRCLLAPPAQCTRSCNAAGLVSAADSSCTFSRLMTCAPGSPLRLPPLERLWRGLKRRNPPPGSLLAVGWKLFASLLAVSPRAGSGNSRLSRSRGNRHGRLGHNSLGGDGDHYLARGAHTTTQSSAIFRACQTGWERGHHQVRRYVIGVIGAPH